MVQIEATFLIVKYGVIYKMSVDPTSKIDRICDILRLFLSSERLIELRDKMLLKYKGIILSPMNKLSWYLYSSGQVIEVYYPDTLPSFSEIDTSIIALRSTQALKEEGIEAVMKIEDELKNEPICLVRLFKVLIAFIQYDPDLVSEIQNIHDNENATFPEKLHFLYNKYRISNKPENKTVLEHLILFITVLLYQDPLVSPEHVISLPENVFEKYLSMMLDILKRYHETNLNLAVLAAYSINYFLNLKDKRYFILDSPTFRNIEGVLYECYDKQLLVPLILAFYNFLFMDSSAIFVEDCIQLFGTINNKILTVIEDETIASLYMNLLALVYKDQSEASRYLYLLPNILTKITTLYFNPNSALFTTLFKTLATITRNQDVLDLLIKNKSLTSTLISSITLSGLKEDHFLYIIATFANLSSKQELNGLLSTVVPSVLALHKFIFTHYQSNTKLVMNYICFINNMVYYDASLIHQLNTIQYIQSLHQFITNTFTPLYMVKAIYNSWILLASNETCLTNLSSSYASDRSLLLTNLQSQAHNYTEMDSYYYKKISTMIQFFTTESALLQPGEYAYDPQTIEESQLVDYFASLPFPNDYIEEKIQTYQEQLYFVTFLLGESKEKYQLYVPVDIKVSALQYLWPTANLKSVKLNNELLNMDMMISHYIHENNKRITVDLEAKTDIVVKAQIDSTTNEFNVNTSYEKTSTLNRDLASAAYQNAKDIINKFKKEVETDHREVVLHQPKIIKLDGEYVQVPWDYETEEDKHLREMKESKQKKDKQYEWDKETNQTNVSFDTIHYEPEVKPVAILRKKQEVVQEEPTIHIIEHKKEDEFTKDLAPLPSVYDPPPVNTTSTEQKESVPTKDSLGSTLLDPIDMEEIMNGIDLESDLPPIEEVHVPTLEDKTQEYILTIQEQTPFTILAYIQLHSTPLYDCLEILKAIEHQCIRVEGETEFLTVYSDVILQILSTIYNKLLSAEFNYDSSCALLHFISTMSRTDNICPLLQKQQYIQMTMQLMTSINQHKPALLDVFVPTFVVPSCFALYYLTSYDDATILCLFMENGLGDYLSSFFSYDALFTYQPQTNVNEFKQAFEGIADVVCDFIKEEYKTRRNVVYDWKYTMNKKLNLTLSTIADEFVNTILTFIDTLNQ